MSIFKHLNAILKILFLSFTEVYTLCIYYRGFTVYNYLKSPFGSIFFALHLMETVIKFILNTLWITRWLVLLLWCSMEKIKFISLNSVTGLP